MTQIPLVRAGQGEQSQQVPVADGSGGYSWGLPSSVVNVISAEPLLPANYDCLGDGVTDDTAGWQAMTTALFNAGSGKIVIPPRQSLYLNPGVATQHAKIPPINTLGSRFVFECVGDGHLKLGANMAGVFLFGRTTDHQTWRGIDFINFAVDANNQNGTGNGDCVLIGTKYNGGEGTFGQRNNYRDINIINPRVWNVPALGSNGRPIIEMMSRHVWTNEGDANWAPNGGSQTTILDILIQNPHLDGGDDGITILGGLQRGESSWRINSFTGTPTVITYLGGVPAQPPIAGDWISIGAGIFNERHQVASVSDNGDGTGTLTLETTLSHAQPQEDISGATLGAPMTSGSSANVWLDRIRIIGGYHITGTGGYGSNVQIGGSGFGGDVTIEDFFGQGSGDNSIELDTILNAKLTRVHSKDAVNESWMIRNFNYPQDQANNLQPLQQVCSFNECTSEATLNTSGPMLYPGYNVRTNMAGAGLAGATPMFGKIVGRGCKRIVSAPQFRKTGSAIEGNIVASFRVLDFEWETSQQNILDGSSTASSWVDLVPCSDSFVRLRHKLNVGGSASSGAQPTGIFIAAYQPTGFGAVIHNCELDIEQITDWSVSGINAGATRLMVVGDLGTSTNTGATHGRVSQKIANFGGADTAPILFRWGGKLSVSGLIIVDDCELSRAPTGMVVNSFQGALPLTYQRRVRFNKNNSFVGTFSNWLSPGTLLSGRWFPPFAISTGGSTYQLLSGTGPWTYLNLTGFDLNIAVYGGTASGTGIDLSYDEGTTYINSAVTNQSSGAYGLVFTLRAGMAMRINGSGVPTIMASVL